MALEKGNFSYLMGCDLDFQNEEVRREVTEWGKWYLDTTGVDGFRLDAIYTNDDGWAEFRCNGGSVSVWIQA